MSIINNYKGVPNEQVLYFSSCLWKYYSMGETQLLPHKGKKDIDVSCNGHRSTVWGQKSDVNNRERNQNRHSNTTDLNLIAGVCERCCVCLFIMGGSVRD